MKKILTFFAFVMIITIAKAQQPCQASFYYTYNPQTGVVQLFNNSYNLDSTQISISSYTWTAQYNGASYTYTSANPTLQVNSMMGYIPVCLTITVQQPYFCQSTFCDTVVLNTMPLDTCVADFTYTVDSTGHLYHFFDQSYTNNGNIVIWSWAVYQGSALLYTSNLQNPVFNLPVNGPYHVILAINSDSSCQTSHGEYVYVNDSLNTPCQIAVNSTITHVTSVNGNDGAIDLTVSGGTSPYTFVWNTGATTEDISNLTAGIYYVAISQSPACPTYTYVFQVNQPSINIILDTLTAAAIDTCLGFTPDSVFVSNILLTGNTITATWVFTGQGMVATLQASYTISYNGSYAIILSISCPNGMKTSITSNYMAYITVTSFSVNENSKSKDFVVYPNPVKDWLHVTLPEYNSTSTIQIYSVEGKKVYQNSVPSNSRSSEINVSKLPQGSYVIKLINDNGNTFTQKFSR